MGEEVYSHGMVSVIMPVYNCERYIETAIRSVMNQTYSDWQLIVIDDRSTDSTCSIVRKLAAEDPRIQLIKNNRNKGAAGARNSGLDICCGKYVAFLDSDDVWLPNKLAIQLEKMIQSYADLSFTSYEIIDETGETKKSTYIVPQMISFNQLLEENVIGCSTVIISQKIAERYRFETSFYHEDYCLWLRVLRDGYVAMGCVDALVKWRLIDGSRSANKRKSALNRWKIYRQYLRLPLFKSIRAFSLYLNNGIRKYYKR